MSVDGHDRARDRLAVDPQFPGEDRRPGERVWFHHPLVVRYRLVPGGGVKVTHVVRLRSRRPDAEGDDGRAAGPEFRLHRPRAAAF